MTSFLPKLLRHLRTIAAAAAAGAVLHAAAQVTVSTVKLFDGAGGTPQQPAAVAWGADGKLYGVHGSALFAGGGWRIDRDGSNFASAALAAPYTATSTFVASTPLVRSSQGRFYGAGFSWGSSCPTTIPGPLPQVTHYGFLYRMGQDMQPTELLAGSTAKMHCPNGGIAIDAADNIYVTDRGTGSGAVGAGSGAIWKVSADETTLTLVRAFTAATDGATPVAMILGSDGFLYGINATGGANSAGTLYRVRTDGTGFEVLRHFVNSTDALPNAANPPGLVEGADGYIYGNSYFFSASVAGTVWRARMGPAATADFRVLHTFLGAGSSDGQRPSSELVLAGDGNIYGTTVQGNTADNYGTLYRIVTANAANADGGYELLHAFSFATEGRSPRRLIRAPNGKLYGLTTYFGAPNARLFQVDIGYTPPNIEISGFAASPSTVTPGRTVTLAWNTQNAASCTAGGAWAGARNPAGGSEIVTPVLLGAHVYTLSCTDTITTVGATVTVTVVPPVDARIVAFTGTPSTLEAGNTVTLTWSTADAVACEASGAWSGSKATAGTQAIWLSATGAHLFTLSCTGTGGTAVSSVAVSVTGRGGSFVDASSGGGGGAVSPPAAVLLFLATIAAAAWHRRRGKRRAETVAD